MGSMVLFSWWLARKQRRSEAEGEGRKPWEALTPAERQQQLRQVAERNREARRQAGPTAEPY